MKTGMGKGGVTQQSSYQQHHGHSPKHGSKERGARFKKKVLNSHIQK